MWISTIQRDSPSNHLRYIELCPEQPVVNVKLTLRGCYRVTKRCMFVWKKIDIHTREEPVILGGRSQYQPGIQVILQDFDRAILSPARNRFHNYPPGKSVNLQPSSSDVQFEIVPFFNKVTYV